MQFPRWARWIAAATGILLAPVVIGVLVLAFAVAWAYPGLPSVEALTTYQPKIPLRIYSADNYLIGEFGEERRNLVTFAEVPMLMKQAILAAEDDRFYQHGGVDTIGVLRAALSNLTSPGRQQGASTITMQVARNFFISSEKTYTRKFYEALLALRIEATLSKDKIFEIYINQIFLGQRSYGFSSAAQIYFGKELKSISAAEAAMLAGLPKAPSLFNPVVNPKRARARQHYILDRMLTLGYLTSEQHGVAVKEVLVVKREVNDFPLKAAYVAEMARQLVFERFADEAYTRGLRVTTTILKADQEAAHSALRRGVLDYDRRHGYRGPEAFIELKTGSEDELEEAIGDHHDSEDLLAAIVLEASPRLVKAWRRNGETVQVAGDGLKFVANALSDKAQPNRRIRRGTVIRIQKDDKAGWGIFQLPQVEAAFVAVNPQDGAVKALAGGFDFSVNKFNHVTQAWRQPGSSFKPFIYSGSLEKGLTPATVINDAPVVIDPATTGGQLWEPKNYDGKYDGPMRMRQALARSKNLVSIRILQHITPQYAQDYVTRFGFDADKHPPYLTLALGAGSVTPWQMAGAYAVFANGGYRINPYLVARITDDGGKVLAQANPVQAGDEALRVIDARNAFVMNSMLNDVTKYGTAARAGALLKRGDLAGKTGTTNDHLDAWFAGYQSTLVGIAWIGFDQPRKLGSLETGGLAALPMWINYMQRALRGVPESVPPVPPGVINAGSEFYYREYAPGEHGVQSLGLGEGTPAGEHKTE